MAKKKNQDQEPEEDKKNQFEEDEDFGLPDLEYEELGDEDDEFEDEMDAPVIQEAETSKTEPELTPEEITEEKSEKESTIEVGEEESVGLSLGAEDSAGELTLGEEESKESTTTEFYEEESFEEFKETPVSGISVFGDETAKPSPSSMKSGLSEDDKKLYNQAVPDALTQKSNRGRFTKIVILGAVLFTVIATVLIFMLGGLGEPTEEITKVETPVPAEPEVKEEPVKEEAKPPANDKLTKIKPGEIANLPQRTGNSYIVVNSFFDGDLAQDYANVLSARGKSPMIIPPFAEYRFYRVAIAEYGTFAEALRNLESFKAEYGTKIWALRY